MRIVGHAPEHRLKRQSENVPTSSERFHLSALSSPMEPDIEELQHVYGCSDLYASVRHALAERISHSPSLDPTGPRQSSRKTPMRTTERSTARAVLAFLLLAAMLSGCSRKKYRLQADRDVYGTIAKSSKDPRWAQPNLSIEPDPRSRNYVPEDVDRPPMPADDPAAHEFMQCVWGRKGYKHWLDDGVTHQLENPYWRDRLGEYVPLTEDGKIILNVDSALRLAYMHSSDYQGQLEELYLTAVDVSSERFAFETQFFGGVDTTFTHLGQDRPGGEANQLDVDSNFDISRQTAAAGTILVGLANQMTWQFAGPDTHSNLSILNFALVQPLLRNGGRAVALERLTRTQRAMLANLRNFQLFRQGFYSSVAVGGFGGGAVRRPGGGFGGTGLTSFTGQGAGGQGGIAGAAGFGFFGFGFGGGGGGGAAAGAGFAGGGAGNLGGFIGLLQRRQQIRNDEYSLSLQQRTLTLLEANLRAGLIDLTQVDNFRQSIQTLRATLAQSRTGYLDELDNYKQEALGLPPDIEFELDDSFVRQFELIDRRVVALQDHLAAYQNRLGALPPSPELAIFGPLFEEAGALLLGAEELNQSALADLQKMNQLAGQRKKTMQPAEQAKFDQDRASLGHEFEKFPEQLEQLASRLQMLRQALGEGLQANVAMDELVAWNRALGSYVQTVSLAQARARLESVVLDPVELDVPTAINVARNYRYDYMNNRAELVDSWRLIEFNANALRSVLDVRLDGDLQTKGDNPVKFRAPTGNLSARLEWDAPLTRILERNNYRQQLIQYAQDRRGLVRFDDGLVASMRSQLRQMDQLYENLEIQRQAVVIAIRRVEFTQSQLSAPLPVPVPGAPPPSFGPTAVQNLLQALADLSAAQNNFMSVWLQYYSSRLQLTRSLGIMELDEEGRWIDRPIHEILAELQAQGVCEPLELPPPVSGEYWQLTEPLPAPNGEPLPAPSGAVLPPQSQGMFAPPAFPAPTSEELHHQRMPASAPPGPPLQAMGQPRHPDHPTRGNPSPAAYQSHHSPMGRIH